MTPASTPLVARIDARTADAERVLADLRRKLSPTGDVISPRGRQLTEEVFGSALTPVEVVRRICREIRESGDIALLHYCAALDKAQLSPSQLRVSRDELQRAHAEADPQLLSSVRRIRDNVRTFQEAILHRDVEIQPQPGVTLRQRYVPLRRVGVCVPGGAAAYPSTILMTVVPAQAAGVEEIAIVAPPTDFGANNPDILATCHELGVTEVYRVGGAQAVAALAYGTDTISPVDKIVGPGNLFVALAKQHVYGDVDIDSIAGPSEVIVIADHTARPEWVAADLLAQAEHSPGSSILITWNEQLLDAVAEALETQVAQLSRSELTVDSLRAFGALILVKDADHACAMTDFFAPEHLQIETREPQALSQKIRNAGATFLGHHTPVALGDYAAGPSHVLPTGGTARWAAGLSSNDFLRSGSVTQFDPAALSRIAPDVMLLAQREGLTAHEASVRIRLEDR